MYDIPSEYFFIMPPLIFFLTSFFFILDSKYFFAPIPTAPIPKAILPILVALAAFVTPANIFLLLLKSEADSPGLKPFAFLISAIEEYCLGPLAVVVFKSE